MKLTQESCELVCLQDNVYEFRSTISENLITDGTLYIDLPASAQFVVRGTLHAPNIISKCSIIAHRIRAESISVNGSISVTKLALGECVLDAKNIEADSIDCDGCIFGDVIHAKHHINCMNIDASVVRTEGFVTALEPCAVCNIRSLHAKSLEVKGSLRGKLLTATALHVDGIIKEFQTIDAENIFALSIENVNSINANIIRVKKRILCNNRVSASSIIFAAQ